MKELGPVGAHKAINAICLLEHDALVLHLGLEAADFFGGCVLADR